MDISKLFFSNIIVLLMGVCNTLIIPAVLNKTDFGYYKIFSLYISYVPLFHFGFIDGVLLKNAGKKYKNIIPKQFRTFSKFIIFFELLLSLIFIFLTIILPVSNIYKLIFIFLGIYNFLCNVSTYYQFIDRFTMDFNSISIVNSVSSIITILLVSLSFIFCKIFDIYFNYYYYCLIIVVVILIELIFYLFKYRNITFGYSYKIVDQRKSIMSFFKNGITLMLGFQAANIIINMDNQFITILFKPSIYSSYAFSYSILSVLLVILGSIASVLLPYMKNYNDKKFILNMHNLITRYIAIFVFFCISAFYPMKIFIRMILPKYIDSIEYLKIILPVVVITCLINVVIYNYFSYLNITKDYLKINLLNVFLTFTIYLIVYWIFRDPISLSYSSIFSMLIWYFMLEYYLFKNYNTLFIKNYLYILLLIFIFIMVSYMNLGYFNIFIYFLFYLLITCLFFYLDIKKLINKIFYFWKE